MVESRVSKFEKLGRNSGFVARSCFVLFSLPFSKSTCLGVLKSLPILLDIPTNNNTIRTEANVQC